MPYTDAQKRATIKYLTEKTDDVRLRVIKGTKERWKNAADRAGVSMTAYVLDAVNNQIAYDETGEHEIDSNIIPNLLNWLHEHGHTHDECIDCIRSLSKTDAVDALECDLQITLTPQN